MEQMKQEPTKVKTEHRNGVLVSKPGAILEVRELEMPEYLQRAMDASLKYGKAATYRERAPK